MERAEAEAVYAAGREAVVEVLLRMDRQIQALTGRVQRLERKLSKNSKNSSRPPSSDPPSLKRGKRARPKGPSGKSQGAQPGHEGKGRELLPTWAVDEVVVHWPARCNCGHAFADGERVVAGESVRHQVEELPQIFMIVVEHQCPRVRCPGCGRRQRAQLPAEIAASAFGPRLQAAIATVSVRNRISRRDAVELVEQLFGARISAGTIDAVLTRAADALADPYEDLLKRVRSAGALNMDETGWRLKGTPRTLWGLFTTKVAVYRIAEDRHEDRARQLLGASSAIVTSDRWWAYNHLPLARRQICWSHVQRDFQALAEVGGAEHELGQIGLRVCDELVFAWEVYQHTGQRTELGRQIRRLQPRAQTDPAHLLGRQAALQAHPRAGAQPAQGLAGALDVRPSAAACSPPTTTPSAHSAARSSTASSRSAANPNTANDASSGCSRPRPRAAYNTGRCSNTSPTCSAPTAAATPFPRSPESVSTNPG